MTAASDPDPRRTGRRLLQVVLAVLALIVVVSAVGLTAWAQLGS